MARQNVVSPESSAKMTRAILPNVRVLARHPLFVLGAFSALLLATIIFATRLGTVNIEPAQIIAITLKRAFGLEFGVTWTAAEEAIIWQIRLPRVLGAAIVGAGLAGAGVVFQGLLRNSMADPYLLGTSGGAALAATIAFLVPFRSALLRSVSYRSRRLSARCSRSCSCIASRASACTRRLQRCCSRGLP